MTSAKKKPTPAKPVKATTADPIFAAIAAHKAAFKNFSAIVAKNTRMEKKWGGKSQATGPGKSAWAEYNGHLDARNGDEQRALDELCNMAPCTAEGFNADLRPLWAAGCRGIEFGLASSEWSAPATGRFLVGSGARLIQMQVLDSFTTLQPCNATLLKQSRFLIVASFLRHFGIELRIPTMVISRSRRL